MIANDLSNKIVAKEVMIHGLRMPNITIGIDGKCTIGCISMHVDDLSGATDAEVLNRGGQEGLDWWLRWKDTLIPFAQLAYSDMKAYWKSDDGADSRAADLELVRGNRAELGALSRMTIDLDGSHGEKDTTPDTTDRVI